MPSTSLTLILPPETFAGTAGSGSGSYGVNSELFGVHINGLITPGN